MAPVGRAYKQTGSSSAQAVPTVREWTDQMCPPTHGTQGSERRNRYEADGDGRHEHPRRQGERWARVYAFRSIAMAPSLLFSANVCRAAALSHPMSGSLAAFVEMIGYASRDSLTDLGSFRLGFPI